MSPDNDAEEPSDNHAESTAVYQLPYLDSSVYIAAIQGERGRAEEVRQVLRSAEQGAMRIVATTLVLAEVHKPGAADWSTERIDGYFKRPHFRWVEVDYLLGAHARSIARNHRLRGADAVHVAGAMRAGADIFFTYDTRILAVADIGIRIAEPQFTGQMSLSTNVEPATGTPDRE